MNVLHQITDIVSNVLLNHTQHPDMVSMRDLSSEYCGGLFKFFCSFEQVRLISVNLKER
jgi:hypothetical protein